MKWRRKIKVRGTKQQNLNESMGTGLGAEERCGGETRDTCLVSIGVIYPSVMEKKSHFQNRQVNNSGHLYDLAKSCLLKNKMYQTAKEKLVINTRTLSLTTYTNLLSI